MPNFKGFMVGNAVTNWKYDATPAFIEMAHSHQLIDPIVYRDILTVCPEGVDVQQDLNLMCIKLINTFYQITMEINIYDIYGKCYAPSETVKAGLHFSRAAVQETCGLEERPKLGRGRKSYSARQLTPFVYNSKVTSLQSEDEEHP
jgi:hypothetical protein